MAEEMISDAQLAENQQLLATEEIEDDLTKPLTPEEIHRRLTRPFHPSTHKSINGFTYIPQAVVRKRVIIATRNQFSWEIIREEFREPLEIQGSGKVIHKVTGRLTIPGLGYREGTGTAQIRKGTEEQYKSADSDGFKRAAMAFGVGLELYPGEMEADVEAGEQVRVVTATPKKGKGESKSQTSGETGTMPLQEVKAGIAAAAQVLGADALATYMRETFKVELSSALTEEQWRRFYAWAQVELTNAKKAA